MESFVQGSHAVLHISVAKQYWKYYCVPVLKKGAGEITGAWAHGTRQFYVLGSRVQLPYLSDFCYLEL